jgi:hypothetical protein
VSTSRHEVRLPILAYKRARNLNALNLPFSPSDVKLKLHYVAFDMSSPAPHNAVNHAENGTLVPR